MATHQYNQGAHSSTKYGHYPIYEVWSTMRCKTNHLGSISLTFLLAFQIRWEFHLNVIQLLPMRLQNIFVHSATTQLSRHVKNCVVITLLKLRWEQNEIPTNLNCDEKPLVKWATVHCIDRARSVADFIYAGSFGVVDVFNILRPRQDGRNFPDDIFKNAFSWMKMFKFRLRYHWRLLPWVQLTIL